MPNALSHYVFFPALFYELGAVAGRYLPEPVLFIIDAVILDVLLLAIGILLGLYLYRRHDSTPR